MKTNVARNAVRFVISTALCVLIMSGNAVAITISLINGGGTAPAGMVGGGNLTDVVTAAAILWQNAILDSHTVTITYSWGNAGAGNLAVHNLVTQAGGRETAGTLVFDNGAGGNFFADPTPYSSSEWGAFTQAFSNNVGGGGGNMNVARFYSGATGLAIGKNDLFTVAAHELGHGLGLSSANTAFIAERGDNDVDVAAPLPNAGAQIPLLANSAHIPTSLQPFVLMNPGHTGTDPGELGIRELCSCADIQANAQISKWTKVDCDAKQVAVPEPAGILLAVCAIGGVMVLRRRPPVEALKRCSGR